MDGTAAVPGAGGFRQSRYLDVVLTTLDQALDGAALDDRQRFLIGSARRSLVRFVSEGEVRPGFSETGLDGDLDVTAVTAAQLRDLVGEEGAQLDESIRAGDDRLAARTAPLVLDVVAREDVEKALAMLGHPNATVRAMQVAPGGRSKETVLLTVEGTDGLPAQLVLRRDLRANTLGTSVVREYALLKSLHSAGVLLPRAFALVDDTGPLGSAFILLERLPGTAGGTSLLSPARSRSEALAAARALGHLHSIAVSTFRDALAAAGTPTPKTLERSDVRLLADEWRTRARGSSPAAEAALRWMLDAGPIAVDNPVLVHGDFGFHNLLFNNERLTAVLDWELAHAGHPGEDLGYLKPSVTAVLPWTEFMAEYRAAGGPAVDLRTVQFFSLFSTVRLLVWTLRGRDLFERGDTDDPLKSDLAAFMLPRVMLKLSREVRDIIEPDGDGT